MKTRGAASRPDDLAQNVHQHRVLGENKSFKYFSSRHGQEDIELVCAKQETSSQSFRVELMAWLLSRLERQAHAEAVGSGCVCTFFESHRLLRALLCALRSWNVCSSPIFADTLA